MPFFPTMDLQPWLGSDQQSPVRFLFSKNLTGLCWVQIGLILAIPVINIRKTKWGPTGELNGV